MTEHVSREVLQLLADGQLQGDATRPVQRHLAECKACASSFEAMKKFDRFVRAMPTPGLGKDFTENLLTQMGIQRRPSFAFRLLGHAASVVGIVLVFLMGASVWALMKFSGGGREGTEELPGQQLVSSAGKWLNEIYVQSGNWLSQIAMVLSGTRGGRIAAVLLFMATLVYVGDWLFGRKRSV